MKKNFVTISGRLAADAVISPVSEKSDVIKFRVLNNEGSGAHEKTVGHEVQKIMPKDSGHKLLERLKKGKGVEVEGRYRKSIYKKGEQTLAHHSIDASFGGNIDFVENPGRINKMVLAGYLGEDSKLIAGEKNHMLVMNVITSSGQKDKDVGVTVVKFGKKDELEKKHELMKKGAGVRLEGPIQYTEKENNGQKYYNAQVNATFENIVVFQYAKALENNNEASHNGQPKNQGAEQQAAQQAPQQAPQQAAQQAPQQAAQQAPQQAAQQAPQQAPQQAAQQAPPLDQFPDFDNLSDHELDEELSNLGM